MQEIAIGLVQGFIYALTAVGLVLIFSVGRIPNFAHGEALMVGAMVTLVTVADHGVPLPLGILFGTLAATALGLALYFGVFGPLNRYPETALLIVSVALVLVIEAAAVKLWGDAPRTTPGAPSKVWDVGGVHITEMWVVIAATAVVLVVGLQAYIQYARAGRAMKAMALNRYAAQLMGIPVRRYEALAFAIGSAMAGVGGALLSTIISVHAQMGAPMALRAFVIIIFAGMGSILGSLLGGLLLGLVEILGSSYVATGYGETFIFIFLVVLLLVRPQGLVGRRAARD
jgi:branched-chain amino acid transport system permease protein